jgi:chromosomal replication initiator protein
MYLCRELTDQSYASIGTRFGGRDHSTVIHAYKKIEDRMEVEPDVRDEVQSIRKRVGGSSFGGFGG